MHMFIHQNRSITTLWAPTQKVYALFMDLNVAEVNIQKMGRIPCSRSSSSLARIDKEDHLKLNGAKIKKTRDREKLHKGPTDALLLHRHTHSRQRAGRIMTKYILVSGGVVSGIGKGVIGVVFCPSY